jgi:hypothetical protein
MNWFWISVLNWSEEVELSTFCGSELVYFFHGHFSLLNSSVFTPTYSQSSVIWWIIELCRCLHFCIGTLLFFILHFDFFLPLIAWNFNWYIQIIRYRIKVRQNLGCSFANFWWSEICSSMGHKYQKTGQGP